MESNGPKAAETWKRVQIGSVMMAAVLAATLLLTASYAHARQVWIVEFRLPQWKTMHFSSAAKADQHLRTVKQLGCEATKQDHDGHIDVRYRCVKWKQMKLATDEEAHKWVHWLNHIGFQTSHEH